MPEPGPAARPGGDGSLGVSTIGRVASACDRLEAAWRMWDRAGPRPRAEDFAPGPAVRAPERARTIRDLVGVEAELRRRDGESPTAAEYLSRFPELTPAEVADALAGSSDSEAETGPSIDPPAGPVPAIPPKFGRYVPTKWLG